MTDADSTADQHQSERPGALTAGDVQSQPSGREYATPGYFKMRSRFADFTGQYVLHCHILAHEDRGMMQLVEVAPKGMSPYDHY